MCMTPMIRSWKEQNCIDLRRTTYCQGWWCFQFIARVGGMNRQSSEEFQGCEIVRYILYDNGEEISLYVFQNPWKQITRLSDDANYGFWMSRCLFISCKKCSTWCKMLIVGGAVFMWEQEVYGKFLYIPLNFL